tara:strand:+ start:340 stop:543 length:204 start_codon:yes stop_codon:yes gene_type:complete
MEKREQYMKTVIDKRITSTKVYQVRTLPIRKGSDYKYRLFVDGQAKTLYKNLAEAEKHLETLSKIQG